jgi:hypothetical protein
MRDASYNLIQNRRTDEPEEEVTMSDTNGRFAASDVEYNVITTLSNLLQAEEVLRRYAQDAEEAGNAEVAKLFNEIEESNNRFSKRLMDELHRMLH